MVSSSWSQRGQVMHGGTKGDVFFHVSLSHTLFLGSRRSQRARGRGCPYK